MRTHVVYILDISFDLDLQIQSTIHEYHIDVCIYMYIKVSLIWA